MGSLLLDAVLCSVVAELLEGLVDKIEDAPGESERDLVFRLLVLEQIEA